MKWLENPIVNETPKIKNHTAVAYKNSIYIFGGYDGKKNHNTLYILDTDSLKWVRKKCPGGEPLGRNGHTATIIDEMMYVLGGWMGSGPYASKDLFVFSFASLQWQLIHTEGPGPGSWNMHTADYINGILYVFRGGDGRDYLNDLFALDVKRKKWIVLTESGTRPPARANHASCLYGTKLFIFGGWDGTRRLNDLHTFDTSENHWDEPQISGTLPCPRAGMSMNFVNGKIYLFGGSGPLSACYNDLHVLNPENCEWSQLEVGESPPSPRAGHSATNLDRKIFIFGGSFGPTYYRDIHILDIDPPPDVSYPEDLKPQLLSGLREYMNSPKHSDITFMIEDKPFYAHKMILWILSEKFKAMLESGMRESSDGNITMEIPDISYSIFSAIMEFLYTGEVHLGAETEGQELRLEYLIEFLAASDQLLIDSAKEACEHHIIKHVTKENWSDILELSERFNARRLQEYCMWLSCQD